ncbi:TPA: class I SAM-dependent methyltransferase [Neisseria oralis]|jgi:methyltransferase type 11
MIENQGVWFEETLVGRYVAEKEKYFFESNTQSSAAMGNIVQLGMDSWLRPSESIIYIPSDVVMDGTALAWAAQSLDILLMPHSHEYCQQPYVALVEAARVLKSGGRLVISGFNPGSLWGMSGWFDGNLLPEKKNCFTLPVFKKKVLSLGFEIEYGKFMVYVPPVKTESSLKFWQFMEKAGDRWWPAAAAVYGLVLVKREAGLTLLPEVENLLATEDVALGAARVDSLKLFIG